MTPDTWKEVRQILDAVLQLPPSERPAYLAQHEATPEVRAEVNALLAHTSDSQLVDRESAHVAPSQAHAAAPAPGSHFSHYRIVRPLGTGGMGAVYLAVDEQLHREVAVKFLRAQGGPHARARLLREARAAAALDHPSICDVHEVGSDPDLGDYIVMQHVLGETLADRLRRGPLPIEQAFRVCQQLAEALAAAHRHGIVHRDIKPLNIILDLTDRPRLLDFGIARALRPDDEAGHLTTQLTEAQAILGTPPYMSPEQVHGGPIDGRSDLFSLGCVLYECLTGVRAFDGDTAVEICASVLHVAPPLASARRPELDAEHDALCMRLLEKSPAARFQSADEVVAAMRVVKVHEQTDTRNRWGRPTLAPTQSSAEYFATRIATHKLRAALAAGVVLLTAAAGWWMVSRRGTVPNEIPSMVVLPFSMIGEGDGYFADGLTEAVTTELGRVGGLRVIASNTAFGYRKKAANHEIASELGVGLVLRGSVQRAGESVRIDVSLIDPSNDTALWSDRYSRDLTNVLALQDEISTQIATTLSNRFGVRPKSKSPSRVTQNPEASDAYLRGLYHLKGRSSSSPIVQARAGERRLAVQELERAVALDPQFALARAALASAYTQRFFYDATDREFERSASQQIDRALEIDPDLAEAYLARAQLTWTAVSNFPHERAIKDLQHAVSINSNLAQAYIELEKVYYHIGLTDRAVDANERAHRLDPSQAGSSNRAFRALVDAGRLEAVRLQLERRGNLGSYARGEALVAMGQLNEARQLLANSRITDSTTNEYDVGAKALLGVVYARLGDREEAERVISAVKPAAENRTALSHMHHAQFNIGAALAWLGRHDEAVEWLTKATLEGYPSYPKFSNDQSLSPLKGHAGFSALLGQLRKDWERWQKVL